MPKKQKLTQHDYIKADNDLSNVKDRVEDLQSQYQCNPIAIDRELHKNLAKVLPKKDWKSLQRALNKAEEAIDDAVIAVEELEERFEEKIHPIHQMAR